MLSLCRFRLAMLLKCHGCNIPGMSSRHCLGCPGPRILQSFCTLFHSVLWAARGDHSVDTPARAEILARGSLLVSFSSCGFLKKPPSAWQLEEMDIPTGQRCTQTGSNGSVLALTCFSSLSLIFHSYRLPALLCSAVIFGSSTRSILSVRRPGPSKV